MNIYFLLFIAAIIIGIAVIISGIVCIKKSPAWGVLLVLSGIIIVIASVIMCLCLGFFVVETGVSAP